MTDAEMTDGGTAVLDTGTTVQQQQQQENVPVNIDTLINTNTTTITTISTKKPTTSKSGKTKPPKPKKSILAEQLRLIELIETIEQKYLDIVYHTQQRQLKQHATDTKLHQQSAHLESTILHSEAVAEEPAVVDRYNQLAGLQGQMMSDEQWRYYVECYYNLPQYDIESELNTYVTLYNELYGDVNHTVYTQPEVHIQQLLNHIAVIEQLNTLMLHSFNGVRQLNCSSQTSSHNRALYYYWSYKNLLRSMTMKHIDLLTASIIYQCDRLESDETRTVNYSAYAHTLSQIDPKLAELYSTSNGNDTQAGTTAVVASPEYSPISYGVWIHNSSKHGRVKRVEFGAIGVQLELPVAFQKNRTSLRVVRTNFDYISDQRYHTQLFAYHPLLQGAYDDLMQYDGEQVKSQVYHFVSVGGIINIEQLALPQPAKRAKGWTIREHLTVDSHTTTGGGSMVTVVPYPADSDGAGAANATSNAPLRIQYTLADTVYLEDREPHYGWWDAKHRVWKQDGITLTKFDPVKRSVNLTLNILKPFAIIQPRALDFPYRHWGIGQWQDGADDGDTSSKTVVSVLGSRFTVQVGVLGHQCQLVAPVSPVLAPLNTKLHTAGDLLSHLSSTGINVQPTVADALYCRKPSKANELLAALHTHIALVTQCFEIESSTASSNLDGDSAVFRVRLLRDSQQLSQAGVAKAEYEAEAASAAEQAVITDVPARRNSVTDSGDLAMSRSASTVSIKPTASVAQLPEPVVLPPLEERIASGYEWVNVLATVATLTNQSATPPSADGSRTDVNEGNEAKTTSLIKFAVCRGVDASNPFSEQFDRTPVDGQTSHVSLRRCLHAYFKDLTEHALDWALNMRVTTDGGSGEIVEFVPYTSQQLLHQQTVSCTLNLLNVFTMH